MTLAIIIRPLVNTDNTAELRAIFFDAVHQICSKHYSKTQCDVWAPINYCKHAWNNRLRSSKTFIALHDGIVCGFANLADDGYIDMFFCRPDATRHIVAKSLLNRLVNEANNLHCAILYANVSITAKSFFQRHGFQPIVEQIVTINGIDFTNYRMILDLQSK